MSTRIDITLTVNGEEIVETVEPRMLLSDFLRDRLGLTGTHVGCEHGVCGACTVRLNGVTARACLTFAAQVDGARIETVEHLGTVASLNRIQQAFRDCVADCGATLLHIHTHKFSPQGVSGVAVLAESHITCHTWPEIGYGAFDVFMCGGAEPLRAVAVLQRHFCTQDVRVTELRRGAGLVADHVAA